MGRAQGRQEGFTRCWANGLGGGRGGCRDAVGCNREQAWGMSAAGSGAWAGRVVAPGMPAVPLLHVAFAELGWLATATTSPPSPPRPSPCPLRTPPLCAHNAKRTPPPREPFPAPVRPHAAAPLPLPGPWPREQHPPPTMRRRLMTDGSKPVALTLSSMYCRSMASYASSLHADVGWADRGGSGGRRTEEQALARGGESAWDGESAWVVYGGVSVPTLPTPAC